MSTTAPSPLTLRQFLDLQSRKTLLQTLPEANVQIATSPTTGATTNNDTPSNLSNEPHTNDHTIRLLFRTAALTRLAFNRELFFTQLALQKNNNSNQNKINSIQTILALAPAPKTLESYRYYQSQQNVKLLYQLREKVAQRTIKSLQAFCSGKTSTQLDEITAQLTPFRSITKTLELHYCQLNGITPQSNAIEYDPSKDTASGNVPYALKEIVYCLTHLTLGLHKENAQPLAQTELTSLHQIQTSRLASKETATPFINRIQNIQKDTDLEQKLADTLSSVLLKLPLTPASSLQIEREVDLFSHHITTQATSLEDITLLQETESSIHHELSAQYDELIEALTTIQRDLPNDQIHEQIHQTLHNPEATTQELTLAALQNLRLEAPNLPKSSTLHIATQIAQNKTNLNSWRTKFEQYGPEAILKTAPYIKHQSIPNPLEHSINVDNLDHVLNEIQPIIDVHHELSLARSYLKHQRPTIHHPLHNQILEAAQTLLETSQFSTPEIVSIQSQLQPILSDLHAFYTAQNTKLNDPDTHTHLTNYLAPILHAHDIQTHAQRSITTLLTQQPRILDSTPIVFETAEHFYQSIPSLSPNQVRNSNLEPYLDLAPKLTHSPLTIRIEHPDFGIRYHKIEHLQPLLDQFAPLPIQPPDFGNTLAQAAIAKFQSDYQSFHSLYAQIQNENSIQNANLTPLLQTLPPSLLKQFFTHYPQHSKTLPQLLSDLKTLTPTKQKSPLISLTPQQKQITELLKPLLSRAQTLHANLSHHTAHGTMLLDTLVPHLKTFELQTKTSRSLYSIARSLGHSKVRSLIKRQIETLTQEARDLAEQANNIIQVSALQDQTNSNIVNLNALYHSMQGTDTTLNTEQLASIHTTLSQILHKNQALYTTLQQTNPNSSHLPTLQTNITDLKHLLRFFEVNSSIDLLQDDHYQLVEETLQNANLQHIQTTLANLIQKEIQLVQSLGTLPESSLDIPNTARKTQQKLATYETLNELANQFSTLDQHGIENQLRILTHQSISTTPAEHALQALMSGRTTTNTPLQIEPVLQEIEKETNFSQFKKHLTSQIRTLRRWRDQEIVPEIINKDSILQTVSKLSLPYRQRLAPELKTILLATLNPQPWETNTITLTSTTAKEPAKNRGFGQLLQAARPVDKPLLYGPFLGGSLAAHARAEPPPVQGGASQHLRNDFLHLRQIAGPDLTRLFQDLIDHSQLLQTQILNDPKLDLTPLIESLHPNDEAPNNLFQIQNQIITALLQSPEPIYKNGLETLHSWQNQLSAFYHEVLKPELTNNFIRPWPTLAPTNTAHHIDHKLANLRELSEQLHTIITSPVALTHTLLLHTDPPKDNTFQFEKQIQHQIASLEETGNQILHQIDTHQKEIDEHDQTLIEHPTNAVEHEDDTAQFAYRIQTALRNKREQIETIEIQIEGLKQKLSYSTNLADTTNLTETLELPTITSSSTPPIDLFDIVPAQTLPAFDDRAYLESAQQAYHLMMANQIIHTTHRTLSEHFPALHQLTLDPKNPSNNLHTLQAHSKTLIKDTLLHILKENPNIDLTQLPIDAQNDYPEIVKQKKQWINALQKTQLSIDAIIEQAPQTIFAKTTYSQTRQPRIESHADYTDHTY